MLFTKYLSWKIHTKMRVTPYLYMLIILICLRILSWSAKIVKCVNKSTYIINYQYGEKLHIHLFPTYPKT